MTLSDGAITAAKIGADAITAAKIATDAITEIQSGLSTLSASDVLSKVNEALDTAIAELGVATPATTPTMHGLDAALHALAQRYGRHTNAPQD